MCWRQQVAWYGDIYRVPPKWKESQKCPQINGNKQKLFITSVVLKNASDHIYIVVVDAECWPRCLRVLGCLGWTDGARRRAPGPPCLGAPAGSSGLSLDTDREPAKDLFMLQIPRFENGNPCLFPHSLTLLVRTAIQNHPTFWVLVTHFCLLGLTRLLVEKHREVEAHADSPLQASIKLIQKCFATVPRKCFLNRRSQANKTSIIQFLFCREIQQASDIHSDLADVASKPGSFLTEGEAFI